MRISNETKVGALTAIAITILILGYSFLSGSDLFDKQNEYTAIYNRINGLTVSDPILINGFRVGSVDDLKLAEDHSGRIIAKFKIDKDYKIPVNTVAEIVSADLLGEKAIELILGDTTAYLIPGDTIQAAVQLGISQQIIQELYPIRDKIGILFASIDSVMGVIQYILNEETKQNIDKSLVNVQKALAAFAGSAATLDTLMQREATEIDAILNNIASITQTIEDNRSELANIISNASAFTDSLAKADIGSTIMQTNRTLEELNSTLGKVNSGEGSLGLLLQNPDLYNNLQDASKNLDKLLFDLRANPERYLHFSVVRFGNKKKIEYPQEEGEEGSAEDEKDDSASKKEKKKDGAN